MFSGVLVILNVFLVFVAVCDNWEQLGRVAGLLGG